MIGVQAAAAFTSHDLDELAIHVRDPESRILYSEAIQAYRAGALRSAVTSTWIAVVFDVLAKIRELAVEGDQKAKTHVDRVDVAVSGADIPTLQKVEAAILTTAAKEFELLSPQERVDLERLQADRNLCAHPALRSDHTVFQPTPELVRTHLVHAALHLLRHPPVQGKSALNKILSEMARPSFPEHRDRVFQIIADRLQRAKEVLIRNLTSVLLKTLFLGAEPELATRLPVVVAVLMAISRTHGSVYERETKGSLAKWLVSLDDEKIAPVFRLAGADPRCWDWLPEASRIRLLEFVSKYPASDLAKAGVFDALVVPALRSGLLERFSLLDETQKQSVIAENSRPEFAEEAIALFSKAGSYRGAELLGQSVILPMASHFSADQLRAVLCAAKENGQIWDALGTGAIMERLFDLSFRHFEQTRDAWLEFITFVRERRQTKDWYAGLAQRLSARGLSINT